MMANNLNHPMFVNDLKFSSTIGTSDKIYWPVDKLNFKTHMYVKGAFRMSIGVPASGGGTTTGYIYGEYIPAGRGFWFDRKTKSQLTISFV